MVDLPDELRTATFFAGVDRDLEPPEPIPNSEVKRVIADDSVGPPHVKVGQRQHLILKSPSPDGEGLFLLSAKPCCLL